MLSASTAATLRYGAWTRWAPSGVFLPLCAYYLFRPAAAFDFTDAGALLLHDAGHVLTAWMGAGASSAAALALHFLAPYLCYAYFSRRGYCFGQQVFLFLFGLSSLLLRRALLGGEGLPGAADAAADWAAVLGAAGLAGQAEMCALALLALGYLSFIGVVLLPGLQRQA